MIPWSLRAPHAVLLGCTISVDEFRSQAFEAELGSTHGIGLGVFYSVSRMERFPRQVRYWTAVARLFRGIDLGRSLWRRLDLVMRIPVTTY
jgi:hypothetical protein